MVSVVTYKFDELALALAVCGPSSYTEGQDVSLILFKITAAARSPRHSKSFPNSPYRSEAAHKRVDNDDQKYKAQSAAGVIAPARAVGPGRKRTDQQNDDQDKGYGSHVLFPWYRFSCYVQMIRDPNNRSDHIQCDRDAEVDPARFGERGTRAPERLASDSPIAIACLGSVTFFPEPPLRSVPCFISRMALPTFCPLDLLYLRAMMC